MNIETTRCGDELIAHIQLRSLDASVTPPFKIAMMEIIKADVSSIVLDFADVKMVDSSGLGALVSVLKAMQGEKELVIRNAAPAVVGLFTLTRMDRVFKVEQAEQA